MKNINPREMMKLAIEVMQATVNELRLDGKPSPLVGAVLVKDDGTIETASRGELRVGDHAEFTLLERKNRANKLDNAILFCTLEPCAPGARNHPKLSCAERIVLARVKDVYVGIEDPDPTVDRKGIKYLQDNGVKVTLFDQDLQEIIQNKNSKFIEKAVERAEEAQDKETTKKLALSVLEEKLINTNLNDLADDALNAYIDATKISHKIISDEFKRHLLQLGLLQKSGTELLPTGFGLILFGKEPRVHLPQSGLLGTIHFENGTEETRDFEGPTVLIPGQVIQWLKDKLPNPITRNQAERKETKESLYELAREGIVNALVHRDYSIQGAKCQVIISPGKIIIKSPGLPVEPITFEQIKSFKAPMLSRNPILHYIFAKMKLAEERGLGLKSMRARASKANLPLPEYSYDNPYITLSIYQEASATVSDKQNDLLDSLNKAERKGWDWLVTKENATVSEYEDAMGIPNRTAKNQLKKMTALGLLKKEGAGPATHYKIIRS